MTVLGWPVARASAVTVDGLVVRASAVAMASLTVIMISAAGKPGQRCGDGIRVEVEEGEDGGVGAGEPQPRGGAISVGTGSVLKDAGNNAGPKRTAPSALLAQNCEVRGNGRGAECRVA